MKILVLTSTYSRWANDTEPQFVDYLCAALGREHEVHVLAPHTRDIPTEESMNGIQVFRFRYFFKPWQTLAYDGGILPSLRERRYRFGLVPFFLLGLLIRQLKLMREHQYDVIHAHWLVPQGLIAVLARVVLRSNARIVVTGHGGDVFGLKGIVFESLMRFVGRHANAVTVVSSVMRDRVVTLGIAESNKVKVIPMGVDTEQAFTLATNKHLRDDNALLFVGRLVDKKGIEYLLQAMPSVLSTHPNARLTIVGEGPLHEKLKGLVAELDIAAAVTFVGAVSNEHIPGFLQGCAVSVFPSVVTPGGDQEGAPVAVMEAMACGCAAIVADYPGARDLIEDGETGLICAQRSPSDLAEKIARLLSDQALRRELGQNARAAIEQNYDWRVISAKFDASFRDSPVA